MVAKEPKLRGEVVQVGKGSEGHPMEIKVGDTVICKSNTAMEVEIEGVKYHLIDSSNCLYIE